MPTYQNHKLKNDGRAIASVQNGLRDLKRDMAIALGPTNASGRDAIRNLLSTRDLQEIFWQNMLARPFSAPLSRLPISMVTGAIPVDLWPVHRDGTYTVSTTHNSFWGMMEPDMWYGDAILGPDSGTGIMYSATTSTYGSYASPASGSVATGVSNVALPDVSSNFVANANTGTEYVHLTQGLALTLGNANNAAVTWTGEAYTFSTRDPINHPLTGFTVDQLMDQAKKEGAMIMGMRYKISQSGLFLPVGSVKGGYKPAAYPDVGGVASIGVASVPLVHTAYEWQKINAARSTALTYPTIAVALVNAPAGAVCYLDTVSIYQTERYPTIKYSPGSTYRRPVYHNPANLGEAASSAWRIAHIAGNNIMDEARKHVSPTVITEWHNNASHGHAGFWDKFRRYGKKSLQWLWNNKQTAFQIWKQLSNSMGSPSAGIEPMMIEGSSTAGPLIEEVEEAGPELAEALPLLAL